MNGHRDFARVAGKMKEALDRTMEAVELRDAYLRKLAESALEDVEACGMPRGTERLIGDMMELMKRHLSLIPNG